MQADLQFSSGRIRVNNLFYISAAGANGGVIVAVPIQTREQYGYDQGPINYDMQPAAGAPPYTPQSTTNPSCPPPPYSDVAPRQA